MSLASAIFPGAAVHQLGYVTSDCKEAMRRYRERYGVAEFMCIENNRTEVAPGQVAVLDIAMAFVRGTMVELIEPAGGADSIYREILPASGFAIRHHHLGYAMFEESEWQAAQREQKRLDLRIALQGEAPGVMRYQYLDTRADLGHYVEFLYYLGEGGKQLLAAVPRSD